MPSTRSRTLACTLVALLLAIAACLVATAAPAGALPPGFPTESAARSRLAALTVRAEGSCPATPATSSRTG